MDIQKITERTIELMGGPKKARESVDARSSELQKRWDQDINVIGRILRSHLFVEHYLNEHLTRANPRLGALKKARLTFAQKLALLDPNDRSLHDMLPGIRHLNAIRNRLAHRLSASLDETDSKIFLQAQLFSAVIYRIAEPGSPSLDPLDILEEFAHYASAALSSEFTPFGIALSKALSEEGGDDTA